MLLISLGLFSQTRVFNVMDFGAKGDGITDDAQAIQQAIDACTEKGGGLVYLPCGKTFMAGPIELKSNIDLHLDAGSVLKANPDENIYRLSAFNENRGEGMLWLHCKYIENLSITGFELDEQDMHDIALMDNPEGRCKALDPHWHEEM